MSFLRPALSENTQENFARCFVVLLALMPVIAFFSARSMAVLPGLAALGFFALWPVFYRENIRFSKTYFGWAIGIVVACALSAVWSPEVSHALEKGLKIALVLVPGALLFSLAQSLLPVHAKLLPRILPVTVIVSCLLIAGELAFNLPLHRFIEGISFQEDLTSAVVNRSIFCAVSLTALCFSLIEGSAYSERMKRVLAFGLGASCYLVLTLCESQSNQLALLLGFVVLFVFPYRKPKIYYAIIALMAVLILVSPWLAPWMFATFADPADTTPWLQDGYAADRMEIWNFISQHILQNPLSGYGVEGTRFMTFETEGRFYESGNVLHPHNFVLQLWAEFGLAGALAGIGFFVTLFLKLRSLPPEKARLGLPMLVYAGTVGVVGYGVWQGWWLGALTLLLAFYALAERAADYRK